MTRVEQAAMLMVRRGGGEDLPAGEDGKRRHYIAEAAYYKAERRGFAPGYEAEDWAEAEKEIDALIGQSTQHSSFGSLLTIAK
jgi:hypothetical protein